MDNSIFAYRCTKCGSEKFIISTGFQNSGETDVLEDEEINVNPEDLFGYHIICMKCIECKKASIAYENECAYQIIKCL